MCTLDAEKIPNSITYIKGYKHFPLVLRGTFEYIARMSNANIGKIKLESISIDKLNPAPYNPRNITDKARQGLSNSLDAFGLLQPIIWNKQTGNVVGGHQRLYDIIQKGATETDVVVVNFSLSKEKAANIALNHSGISGDYENDKLQELLSEIESSDSEGLNFDELKIPVWEPLDEVEKEDYQELLFDKIFIKVLDSALTLEVKDLIKRTLADHYSQEQVTLG